MMRDNAGQTLLRVGATTIIALLALHAPIGFAAENDPFPGLRALMTEQEFEAAGLNTLSAAQLKALDDWLADESTERPASIAVEAAAIEEPDAQVAAQSEIAPKEPDSWRDRTRDDIESAIVGAFTGWRGETVFELENGQVWRQRLDGRHRYKGAPNPRVRITRNWLGFFELQLIETGHKVGVARVR